MSDTLIAYFSRADENYFGGAIRYADTFRIEMKNPYSSVYLTCIDEAKKDLKENARPELTSIPESIDNYSTIILAYPNYWGTIPMAVATFLESFDFSEKIIHHRFV